MTTAGVLVGGGGLTWEGADGTYTYKNGVLVPDTSTHSDAFFVLEPHVAIELNVYKLLRLDAGAVARRLRAVGAILRAAAGLDREQGGELDLCRIEVPAVNLLGAKQQLGQRQLEQRADRPGVPALGLRHGVVHRFPRWNRN